MFALLAILPDTVKPPVEIEVDVLAPLATTVLNVSDSANDASSSEVAISL